MAQTISQLLASIYGLEAAVGIDAQIRALLAEHGFAGAALAEATGRRPPLSQRDALLITYGDQVREPGAAPLRSLGDFLRARAHDLVSGVHLLPFYPSSSDDGFSVMDYFAVDPDLGGWDDLARLGESFDLMFDAVFNHVSARGEWFQGFLRGDPEFENFFIAIPGNPDLSQVVRPRALPLLTAFPTPRGERRIWTTFSADQVDLNFQNPRVLLAVLKALLFYAAKGARFIRLDAIAYLWKEIGTPCIHLPQTHRIIQLMRAVLDKVAPEVMLITETNVPHAENLSYFGDGTNEAQLVYNFALPPLVLHSLLTGSAAALNRWTASLRLPSDRVAFFNFLASHDGIGLNPARGLLSDAQVEALVSTAIAHGGMVSYKHNADGTRSPYELNITYFDALSDPGAAEPLDTQIDRFMTAHAMMLSLAGMPGIYVHSLFGSRNDRAGAEASGIPRRINRRKHLRAALERELDDPASLPARVLARFRELLSVRRSHPAFHPQAPQQVIEGDERVFALLRFAPDSEARVLCVHNLAPQPVKWVIPSGRIPPNRKWIDLFTNRAFASSPDGGLPLPLKPYETVWLHPS